MSATDKLRAMLDSLSVEYFKHEDGEPLRKLEKADEPATSWRMGGASVCAVPIEGSDLFDLWIDHCTPEQAIAATLGSGECEYVIEDNMNETEGMGDVWFRCTNCDTTFDYYADDWLMKQNFCPHCGFKVRKAVKR